MTGTSIWCSCGSTWRNQPTAPASHSTPPRMLSEALVSSPAKISDAPSASRKGHAVGAGSTTVSGLPVTFWSGDCIEVSITYSVMKYTTVSTTTHTASTKCQYSAKTSIFDTCSCSTYP